MCSFGERKTVGTLRNLSRSTRLNALLFIIFVNSLLKELKSKNIGLKINRRNMTGLMFADDLAAVTNNPEKMQDIIDTIYNWCRKWGLVANLSKCAMLQVQERKWKFKWGDQQIENKESYEYLGVIINTRCDWSEHIEHRRTKSRKKLMSMAFMLRNQQIPIEMRQHVFKSCIQRSLTGGKVGRRTER